MKITSKVACGLLPFLLALTLWSGLNASGLAQEFESRVQAVETAEDAIPVIQQYLDKMSDIDDWRVLQNYWMRADKDACQAFFVEKHSQNPESPDFTYLWLRNLDDSLQQLRGGRGLIAQAPEFYWGYRIFSATYAQALINPEAAAELKTDIQDHLDSDQALLKQGLKRFPRDDYLKIALFHYYFAQNDYAKAEDYLVRMEDPSAIETNFENILDFIVKSKRVKAFEVLFPKMLAGNIAKGNIASKDSLGFYQSYYLQILSQAEQWEKMQKYFKDNPDLTKQDETLSFRIDMYLGLKDYRTALNLLEGALAKEVLKFPDVEKDPAYEPLHKQPRWDEVIAVARKNWDQSKSARKTEALAARTSKPAPLWELPDANGNMLRLEDLRGKIVILDFWATWCNPCMRTMPLLDAWTKANSAEDIKVISIDTWENPGDQDKAKALFTQQGFAMTLLIGNNDIPKAYGISGIPHICVLDKQGNIAYEHSGYTSDLPDLLNFWVEDLRR